MEYGKWPLDYRFKDLEPYIDRETVCIHYTRHLQTYVDNLNKVLKGYEDFTRGKSLEEILYYVEEIPEEIKKDVINQGGGVANHNLYFSILAKKPKRYPTGELSRKINRTFGSLEDLQEIISEKAISRFGSGYAWLVVNNKGDLEVISTANQDSPLIYKMKPILTIDVWEHAYYLKYKNLRADYVKRIWCIIDWERVEEYYLNGCPY